MLRLIDDNGFFVEDILSDTIPYLTEIVTDVIENEDGTTYEVQREEIVMHDVYDENGDIIGSEPTLDPHYIDVSCQEGFYLPKWDGEKWVEGGTIPEPTPTPPTTEDRLNELENAILFMMMEV